MKRSKIIKTFKNIFFILLFFLISTLSYGKENVGFVSYEDFLAQNASMTQELKTLSKDLTSLYNKIDTNAIKEKSAYKKLVSLDKKITKLLTKNSYSFSQSRKNFFRQNTLVGNSPSYLTLYPIDTSIPLIGGNSDLKDFIISLQAGIETSFQFQEIAKKHLKTYFFLIGKVSMGQGVHDAVLDEVKISKQVIEDILTQAVTHLSSLESLNFYNNLYSLYASNLLILFSFIGTDISLQLDPFDAFSTLSDIQEKRYMIHNLKI